MNSNMIDSRQAFPDSPQVPDAALAEKVKQINEGKLKALVVYLPVEIYKYYETTAKLHCSTMDLACAEVLKSFWKLKVAKK